MQLLHCTMALGWLVGWREARLETTEDHLTTYWCPGNTHTHTQTVSLSDSGFVWMFLYLSSPSAIESVNMLYSALTYESTWTIMCNRLLHAPTNWSLPKSLFETPTFRLLLCLVYSEVLFLFIFPSPSLDVMMLWSARLLSCNVLSHTRPVGVEVSFLFVYTWDVHDSRYLCNCLEKQNKAKIFKLRMWKVESFRLDEK